MKRWPTLAVTLAAGMIAGGYFVGPMLQGQVNVPAALPQTLTSYRDVVKKCLPAVVSIETEGKVAAVGVPELRDPFEGFNEEMIPEEFRRFFQQLPGQQAPGKVQPQQLQVPERTRMGFGSGFVVDPDGVIMTNYHVVAGADRVTVQLLDGRKFLTDKIYGDRKTDLAIVKVDTKGERLPHLELGDSDAMEIGDRVLAMGAPFGLRGSVTHGIVSAKGRDGLGMNMYEDFLQTDAAINPGNSGGPLVNIEGKVVGINAAIKSRSGGFNGVGLAVASNLARSVKSALLRDGVVHRGYLGVKIGALEPDVATRLGLKRGEGVLVNQVFDGTPAQKAGLQPGDVITAVGSKAVSDSRQIQMAVAVAPLNKPLDVEVLRDGERKTVPVVIEEQPEQFGALTPAGRDEGARPGEGTSLDKIGVTVADLNAATAAEFGYDTAARGVVITAVERGSLAAGSGLRPGMLIVKVDNQSVGTAAEAQGAVAAGSLERGVLLQIRSPQGGTNYVLLQAQGN